MMESGSAAFLQQAHRNNWQQYLASLRPDARSGWDVCVLTASDDRQAAMYRRQLDWRREAGLLPARTQFLVIPDPGGQRIGSGGATLRVLAMLGVGTFNVPRGTFERILIIHSGGDSRRLPHCSATGKLFARVPRVLPDGRASTLFDEFLISLSGLAVGLPPGVLIASGDVVLIFDHLQLSFQRQGVTGVAAAVPAEMGTRHGVYVSAQDGHDVRAYLHKPPVDDLTSWGAVHADGTVQLDTGLVWLDVPTAGKFVALAGDNAVSAVELNLYGDLLLPLSRSTTFESYLADMSDGLATPAVQSARQVIWEQLRGTPFTVERLQPAMFVHFGTSHEYWHMIAADERLAQTCGWTSQAVAWLDEATQQVDDRLVLINAAVEGMVEVGSQPVLVVDSHLAGGFSCQDAAVVAGVDTAQSLALAQNVVLHQMPVDGGFVTRIFGLLDDPKHAAGDPSATFMNRPWADWLAEAGIAAEALWPDLAPAERTLWNAQLYPVAADREASLRLALPLQDPGGASADWRTDWSAAPRLSLAQSFAHADGRRILADLGAVEDHVAARRFYAAIVAEQPAAEAKAVLGVQANTVARRCQRLDAWLREADPILQLRGYKALAVATGEVKWEDQAFETLAGMIRDAAYVARWASTVRRRAWGVQRVQAAARIDFGGGWTDTPPYSIECGGTVLNAAITLRGKYPIVAEGEWLDRTSWGPEPRLVLDSRDIEATLEPTLAGEVLAYANPADPFALLKAALVLRGIIPGDIDPDTPLADILNRWGRGLRLSTKTFIPRGSGLGTSSIMAGAVLTCLARLLEVELSQEQLFDEVLYLEQMLTTGGGWQDQVGGLTGGIKLVTTEPGLPQSIEVEPVRLSPQTEAGLDDRLLLVYTGQQRLAKNLLQNIMGRWMARDPEMVWIQGEIARLAVAMKAALETDALDTFGGLLSEHWALNKRMDPDCTNPFINELFETMGPYICGGKLAGAGGGGFAIVVTKDSGAGQDLKRALAVRYPGTRVAVWPSGVPKEGIHTDSLPHVE